MPPQEDPYEVLGVPPDADVHAIRTAYRRAALKVHPDSRPDNPAAAQRRFTRLTDAYHAALRATAWRAAGKARPVPHYRPQDFTRLEIGWTDPSRRDEPAGTSDARDVPGARKAVVARLNEPAAFVACWIVAIAVATTVGWLLVDSGALGPPGRLGPGALIVLGLLPLTAYAAVAAAGIVALVLSRQVVWLVGRIQLGFRGRRSLPAPDKALPRGQGLLSRLLGRGNDRR